MKKTLFLLLLLLSAIPCAARETCGLTLADAPSFFGLKLEISPAQVKSVFGKSLKLKVKREGAFFQNFIDKPPPAFLPGVRALYLRFFDSKLYQIEVFYEARNTRQTLAEFVAELAAEKKLPLDSGEIEYGKFKLSCGEFSFVADNVLNPRIELTDDAARARFEESQKRTAKNQ